MTDRWDRSRHRGRRALRALRHPRRARRREETGPAAERKLLIAQAKELEQAGDLAAAVRTVERAIDVDGSRPADRYRLGRLHTRAGDLVRATAAYREGLDRDVTAREIDYVMLEGTTERFAGRRLIAHFVEDHLRGIQEAAIARHARPPRAARSDHVFVYWAQGFADAPPVVQLCLAQLMAIHAPGTVVALDDESLPAWADIPREITERARPWPTQYSDLVRCALLARHGGVWVDATTLVVEPLPAKRAELTPTGFFTFRYRPTRIASWLMAAEPRNHVFEILLETQLLYWRTHSEVVTYFMFHDMLEALCHLDPPTALIVEASPYIRPSWMLQKRMGAPYDAVELEDILARSFAHKLSYKKAGPAMRPGTVLTHLVEHGLTHVAR